MKDYIKAILFEKHEWPYSLVDKVIQFFIFYSLITIWTKQRIVTDTIVGLLPLDEAFVVSNAVSDVMLNIYYFDMFICFLVIIVVEIVIHNRK